MKTEEEQQTSRRLPTLKMGTSLRQKLDGITRCTSAATILKLEVVQHHLINSGENDDRTDMEKGGYSGGAMCASFSQFCYFFCLFCAILQFFAKF